MNNENPIFIEYYPHEGCECYKILNPFTKYAKHILVLCKVSDGYDKARDMARSVMIGLLDDSLSLPCRERFND